MISIRCFAQELVMLCASGEKESITIVEEHIDRGDVVQYISEKYKLEKSIQTIAKLDKQLASFSGYVQVNKESNYGITSEDAGLLLIVSLLLDLLV